MRKIFILLVTVLLMLITGCGTGGGEGNSDGKGEVGRSYVHGELDSFLAAQLEQVFSPRVWQGETDGPVIMSAASLLELSETQKDALRTALQDGNAILVTKAGHAHVTDLHALNGSFPAISLDKMPASQNTVELYALAAPHGLMRAFAIRSIPLSASHPDPESRKNIHVKMAADWFLEHVRGVQESSMPLSSPDPLPLSTTYPWQYTETKEMPAYWANCDKTEQCSNSVKVTIQAWMVYNHHPLSGQPSDFFIVGTQADVDTSGCTDVYKNNERIAAYWLRQFNISAKVTKDFGAANFILPAGQYTPVDVNPDTEHTSGFSWSIGASVTAGPGNNAIGASAGVAFENSITVNYPAVATWANMGNTAEASWTYDSWNSVDQNIKHSDQACGGPGLNKSTALPVIIYGKTFTCTQNWLWTALPTVREQLGTNSNGFTYLPVEVDTSMLLGWAFYEDLHYPPCSATDKGVNEYYYINGGVVYVVGDSADAPSNGLVFDVGCDVKLYCGSIPLGPYDKYRNTPSGYIDNPGQPYPFLPMNVNIPFAPDPAAMTLTGISPVSGLPGTAVTLTGHLLNTATQVNFGGKSIDTFTIEWPEESNGEAKLIVTAPNPFGEQTVEISVSNAATFSQSFEFTYEQ